jgi:hypothetical protein
MERMRQKGPADGYLGLNLMAGIAYKHAVSPINRTVVISGFGADFGTTKAEQMTFFADVDDPRFIEIRKHIPKSHVDDAFHLWTAENNNLHFFLTMDKRFFNNIDQKKNLINSSVSVETPKSLCELLNLNAIDLDELKKDRRPFS